MRTSLWVFSGMALVSAAAFIYGCSDDDSTGSSPNKDAGGGGTDSSTPTDSGGNNTDSGGNTDSGKTTLKAKATLTHTGLGDAGTPSGTVEFEDDGTGTLVKISITGSTAGDHGMHVHAVGDCGNDGGFAMNAGGHWNPTDAGHGYPDAAVHHAGDLGMVTVSAGGTGTSTLTVQTIKLTNSDPLNPIGKAVVFHQAPDDGAGVNGDAGARAACGIIQAQ